MAEEDRKTFFDRHAASWDKRFHDVGEHARLSQLVASFGLAVGNAVLDVGTGTGVLLPFLREIIGWNGRLVAMDFSFKMLQHAAERGQSAGAVLLNASVESIPFCSHQFDCVTCFAAFPHFPDKEKALLEMVRVLRPGGKVGIAHLKSAEEINRLHGHIGGAVACDHLPHAEALRLLMEKSGLTGISLINQPGRFLAEGRKA
ncbi:MAG TPA: methyltransferase domain-containing protein [Syntrophorhabdales bacterium]|nr:methyltransferase domain-containing protein [Syntrophorhabdales bacterium]